MRKIYKSIVATSVLVGSLITTMPMTIAQTNQTSQDKPTVLFDRSHAQTAGAADWTSDGAFSDYADSFKEQGYQVKDIDGQSNIKDQTLKQSQILVIPEANIPFKTTEQNAIANYVKQGGNVIFISDHYNADRNLNRIDSSEAMNGYRRGAFDDMSKGMTNDEKHSKAMQDVKSSDWLSNQFGIRFRYNALGNVTTKNIVSPKESMGITKDINSVSMHAGSTLAITDPNKAKGIVYTPSHLSSKDKWSHAVDQGVYNNGGIKEGPYVAISKVGQGKAAFIGDSSLVEDSSPKYKREDTGENKKTYNGFHEEDNGKLLEQITKWMNQKDKSTSLSNSNVKLDQKTPLHSFEQPQNSKEPEKEPWSQPPSGYKWYDPSTFKAGSYGSKRSTNDQQDDTDTSSHEHGKVKFELPKNIVKEQPFNITVTLTGFPPNKTITDLKLGIYKDNGRQIGQFSNQQQSFSQPGYSTPQSVKTDDNGNATIQFKAKTTEDIDHAKIRLKQDSQIIDTKDISST
ncbi:DNA-binding protein [Staphylococcus warneri]|uniref:DNA-binding protein n=1 Tax=Staphylococcus warneri TaxID=1292 RepID=UPI0032609BF7